jgi:hypothetical protein
MPASSPIPHIYDASLPFTDKWDGDTIWKFAASKWFDN